MGLLEAAKWLMELGINSVVIELGCKFDVLHCGSVFHTEFGSIFVLM